MLLIIAAGSTILWFSPRKHICVIFPAHAGIQFFETGFRIKLDLISLDKQYHPPYPEITIVQTAQLHCKDNCSRRIKENIQSPEEKNDMLQGIFPNSRQFLATAFDILLLLTAAPAAWAGPPFITDDPETVAFRHGEFYIASQYANDKDGKSGTLPHFEFNYGIIPDVQLHLLVPLAFDHPDGGPKNYGLGDTEVGVKYRFIHESETIPQIGIFPIAHVPTGDSDLGLGNGYVQTFLPIWVQKSWGPWTTYGGGGYWINPGADNKDFWQIGWLGQREITKSLSLGAEIFYFGKDTEDGRDRTGYNIGGIFNLTGNHHILFSAGSDIAGDNRFSAYVGYQWTFKPQEVDK
jgi:hypothetical protein